MTRQRQRNESQKRDVFGRNSSYLRSCLPNMGNLETIDLYSHDLESGYTPLHITLKLGYLQNAFRLYKHWKDEVEYLSYKFGGHILDQVDREGLTPLELYSLELEVPVQRFPQILGYRAAKANDESLAVWGDKITNQNSFGSYILTWGSNVNYQLGTGTKDDRRNMFQLSINQLENNGYLPNRERFKLVFMRRYHALILTTNNKIYTCGSGSRCRLNNGTAESLRPTFTEAWNLKGSEVKMIASSDHHTLVLIEGGAVYSWGWNAYGQSGQSLTRKPEDKNINTLTVPSPRRINFLGSQSIDFVACSNVHSCAATASGNIILWGLNLGQMGTPKPAQSKPDLHYHDEEAFIVNTPVVFNLPSHEIEQVVCTERVTFVRTQGNTLYVLTNYKMRTFKIPLPKPRHYKEIDVFDHFTPRNISSEVTVMKCSNRVGNKICFLYSSGRIGIVNWKEDDLNMWSKMPNSLPVTLYWMPNLRSKRITDFDVSAQGKLLVCTVSGEVYTIDGVGCRPEKVHSDKLNSGKAVSVSCDSSFASFITVKSESSEIPMSYPKDTLYFEFSQYSPSKRRSRNRTSDDLGLLNEPRLQCEDFLSNHEFVDSSEDDGKGSPLQGTKKNISSPVGFRDSGTSLLSQHGTLGEANFDVTFVDLQTGYTVCYCHKLILQIRCQRFTRSIEESGRYTSKGSTWEFVLRGHIDANEWIIDVKADKDMSATLGKVVHFLYTDERQPGQDASKLLFDFVDNLHHSARLPISLQELWTHRCSKSHYKATNTDVRIYLHDGIVEAHAFVLSTRSTFFRVILKKDWVSRDEDGYMVIDLRLITAGSKTNLEFVLGYIYGANYEDLFSQLTRRCAVEYLQFFLGILELSDFLSLGSFKNFLESLIAKYINGETVIPILINAAYHNCRLLVFNCCWFLCTRIGMLFSNENTELISKHFDLEIWQSLEDMLRQMRSSSVNALDNISWYHNNDFDWLYLFHNDIKSFNDHFVDSKHTFTPIFGLKPQEVELKLRTKSFSGKGPSVYISGQSKSRKSSFEKVELRRLSHTDVDRRISTDDNGDDNGDDTVIDDTDHFIEVTKGRRRRSSRHSDLRPVITDQTSIPGKIVIHSPQERSNSDLPSLTRASSTVLSSSATDQDDKTSGLDRSTAKMNGIFKKNSQRQRLKHAFVEESVRVPPRDQQAWKNPSSSKSDQRLSTSSSSSSSAMNNLPSLYDADSGVSLNISKKEKKKNRGLTSDMEFVSYGTPGGISPYLQKSAIKQMRDNSPASPTAADLTMTLQEKSAAQQFERWFAEQSKNVQGELNKKKKNRSLARELDVVYNAAQTLPDFVQKSEDKNKKCKKRLKLKFESRQM